MSVVETKRDQTAPALLNGSSAQARLRARVGEFAGDRGGNVMMTFGLMAISLFGMVGGAVDLGRWLNARDQTISAIDAAVLAAGRALQTDPTNVNAALDVARAYYAENTTSRIDTSVDTVDFEVINSGGVIQATGTVKIKTPLLGIADLAGLDLNELPLFSENETPQAIIKQESDIGWNREISLMLDVSGSMCSPCTKLSDMKLAAVDLINLVMKDPGAETWTKVAVVPFSGDVRPPSSILSLGDAPDVQRVLADLPRRCRWRRRRQRQTRMMMMTVRLMSAIIAQRVWPSVSVPTPIPMKLLARRLTSSCRRIRKTLRAVRRRRPALWRH